jgi:hypothetical protein
VRVPRANQRVLVRHRSSNGLGELGSIRGGDAEEVALHSYSDAAIFVRHFLDT